MATLEHRLGTLTLLASLIPISAGYVSIPFNNTYYFGPDGPWQSVVVDIRYLKSGPSSQSVNLLPAWWGYAGAPAAWVPGPQVCASYPNKDCAIGGSLPPPSRFTGNPVGTSSNTFPDGWFLNCSGTFVRADVQITTAEDLYILWIAVATSMRIDYPSGVTLGSQQGFLSLGSTGKKFWKTNPTYAAFKSGYLQSNSFSLHIGAAALGYSGSLVFGGYDRGRVIGPLVSFNPRNSAALQLLDVTVGVEDGESPSDFTSRSCLLISEDDTATQSLPAFVLPQYPYIALPQSAVHKITSSLPVYFDTKSGYYLWNTEDGAYKNIVTSSAYLGFVFPGSGSDGNIIIKVPFTLLNLTLETSASGLDSDVPYLPIVNSGDLNKDKWPTLGRAFLQAAFVGANWETDAAWLAQAPGPGKDKAGLGSDDVRNIESDATKLDAESGENLFRESWQGYWKITGSTSKGPAGPTPPEKGLSGGAIAGIVVGVVAFIAILGAILFLALKRRKQTSAHLDPSEHPDRSSVATSELEARRWSELETKANRRELHEGIQAQELPSKNE